MKVGKGGCYNYSFPEPKELVKGIEVADLESTDNVENTEEYEYEYEETG